MATTKDTTHETYDTWGVTVAFAHPTPQLTETTWGCAGYADPDVFDPTNDAAYVEAQAICADCDVRSLCLTLGTDRKEWGVWGGVLLEGGKPVERVRQRGRPKRTATA